MDDKLGGPIKEPLAVGNHEERKGRKCPAPPGLTEEKDPSPKSFNSVIEVGAEFDSFDSLDNAIRVYEAENFVNLITRDTRRIEAAEKRNRRKNYNPAIKYSDVCYCCTYGGKKFKSRSLGKRTHKTTKQACPFNVKVRATLDGQRLFIREMCTTHNHEINEAEFRLHPKQRKLDHVSQEEIATLLSLEPDKKLLREKLMQVTGKVILMKDIHNIKTRLVNTKVKDQVIEEITGLSSTSHADEDKNEHRSQITVVELVDDLTDGSGHLTCDLQEGKHELVPNSLAIHIPVTQIAANELTSVLNTIVNTNSESVSGSLQENQSQSVAVVDPVDLNASVEFSHPSAIFPCPLDSFSQHTHEVYQVTAQPLLSDVGSVVAPSPSIMNIHDHTGLESRHQSFSPLDDVNTMGINVLHSLQPWQDLESHNPERTNFQTVNTHHLSHRNTPVITHHDSGSLGSALKISPINQSLSLSPGTLTATNNSNSGHSQLFQQHQQQEQQLQQQQPKRKSDGGRRKPRTRLSSQTRKTRRNPIESDKEALKKKYFQQASVNLFFNERFSFPGNVQTRKRILTSASKKMADGNASAYHEMLKPLTWLFGTWKGQQGQGYYPTIDDFSYAEKAEFYPVAMKPMIEYKFYSTKPDGSVPLHRETGFIRIKPNSNHIAFVASHNLGIAEVQEGEVKDGELTVETTSLARVSFNKPPVVEKVRRTLKRIGEDLEHVMDMQTEATEMTEHLRITFKKVDS